MPGEGKRQPVRAEDFGGLHKAANEAGTVGTIVAWKGDIILPACPCASFG